jgi:hypothetical protein
VTGQKVEEHKGSLDFFTGDRWQTLIPASEESQWKKCMIWVRTNIDRPSRRNPATSNDPADVLQFTIEYDDFVRGKICDDEVLRASVRGGERVAGLTPESLAGYQKAQLLETCKELGIRCRKNDSNGLLVAKIKEVMEWGITYDELQLLRTANGEKEAEIRAAEADQVVCSKKKRRLAGGLVAEEKT